MGVDCLRYRKSSISETSRNLKARIYECKRRDNHLNSLVIHKNKTGDKFDFINAILIRKEQNPLRRKFLWGVRINLLPSISNSNTLHYITNIYKIHT